MIFGQTRFPAIVATIVVAGLVCAPLLVLCMELLWTADSINLGKAWPGTRGGLLLFESFFFSLCVTILGLMVAIPAASLLMDVTGYSGQLLRLLAIAPVTVPPFLHAMAWQRLLESIGASTQGFAVTFAVEAAARLPLLLAAVLIGLHFVDPRARNAALIYAGRARTFFSITLPQARPAIIAGACMTMVFSLNEYGLPALFQRHTYALEIFAEYSVSGSSVDTLLVALPLVLLSILFAVIAIRALSSLPSPVAIGSSGQTLLAGPWLYDLLRTLAVAVAFSPLLVLLWGAVALITGSGAAPISMTGFAAMADSAAIALAATIMAVPCAWLLAENLHRHRLPVLWLVVLIGIALPASLSGAGSIRLWSWIGGELMYKGWGLPLAGMLVGLIPLATLLLYAVIRNSDHLPWDAARVYHSGPILWWKIRLFQIWPGVIGAFFLLFALSLPELELSLLLSPPGFSAVGIRIFNYLHYGAHEQVAYLILLLLLVSLLLGGTIYQMIRYQVRLDYREREGYNKP